MLKVKTGLTSGSGLATAGLKIQGLLVCLTISTKMSGASFTTSSFHRWNFSRKNASLQRPSSDTIKLRRLIREFLNLNMFLGKLRLSLNRALKRSTHSSLERQSMRKLLEFTSSQSKVPIRVNHLRYGKVLIWVNWTESDARRCLEVWIEQAATSGLLAFEILAKSFRDKMAFLLNWFKKRVSSAISEGFNNKIKRLKRMAYGYRDPAYFLLKIHQHCGLLNPRIQH